MSKVLDGNEVKAERSGVFAQGVLTALKNIRAVSQEVARAVGEQAIKEGLAQVDAAGLEKELVANIWEPVYEPYEYSGP
jgi:malate dehydrogenase (oxaloacetate-decarboxylating)